MVKIRPAYTSDLNEIVAMYKEIIKTVHPNKKLGSDYHFYKKVISWIDLKYDLVISENDGKISGFSLSFVDDMSGLVPPMYYGAEIYVKPEYRHTKAFYLLIKNGIEIAKSKNMDLISDAVPAIADIHKKLGGVPLTIRHERKF